MVDDGQAMALVKKLDLGIGKIKGGDWVVHTTRETDQFTHATGADLNRAIYECAARVQKAKNPAAA